MVPVDPISQNGNRKILTRHDHETPLCTISQNGLASKYIGKVLDGCEGFRCMPASDAMRLRMELDKALFILDGISPIAPLGECVSRLAAKFRCALFVVIGQDCSDNHMSFLLSLGVQGFVSEQLVESELRQAVRTIADGGLWMPARILHAHMRSCARPQRPDHMATTPREREVLELLQQRLSNKEIGDLLQIQESTVKYHVSNLLGKLQVARRHELVRANGIINSLTSLF